MSFRLASLALVLLAGCSTPAARTGPSAPPAETPTAPPEPTEERSHARLATLDDVHLAISIGEAPDVETYVVLLRPDVRPAGPVRSSRSDALRTFVTRTLEGPRDAAVEDALGRSWTVYGRRGTTCAGSLGEPVALELVDLYRASDGAPVTVGEGGELEEPPYTWLVAAPLRAACEDDARIALPAELGVARWLAPSEAAPPEAERARVAAFVSATDEDRQLLSAYREASLALGLASRVVEAEVTLDVDVIDDLGTGEHFLRVERHFGAGCGDGISASWTLVREADDGSLEIVARGTELAPPELVLDLEGDGHLELVFDFGVRSADGELDAALAITRDPWVCPC